MDIIKKYFPDLSEEQEKHFAALKSLYTEWNEKINVISRKDIGSLYEKHVLHSLAIAKTITFVSGTTVLDIGCGGGFPGIPLAILFPETQFMLVDSIGKKIKVVNAVAEGVGLKNVKARQSRAENVKLKFDFVISRAVTRLPEFTQWTLGKFESQERNSLANGILYLKGGDISEELAPFKNYSVYNIKDFFTEDFFETKLVVHLPAKQVRKLEL